MTASSLATGYNLVAFFQQRFKRNPASKPDVIPQPQKSNITPQLLNYLRISSYNSSRNTNFWRLLSAAVSSGKLSLTDISDIHYQPNSPFVALNHERLTGLLEEQNLPFANLTANAFASIIKQGFPQAQSQPISSVHSVVCNQGTAIAEKRLAYLVDTQNLLATLRLYQSKRAVQHD